MVCQPPSPSGRTWRAGRRLLRGQPQLVAQRPAPDRLLDLRPLPMTSWSRLTSASSGYPCAAPGPGACVWPLICHHVPASTARWTRWLQWPHDHPTGHPADPVRAAAAAAPARYRRASSRRRWPRGWRQHPQRCRLATGGHREDLLIGVEHGDDAAVVRIAGDRAIVATADFFTPVVDDARTFGRIAAANALSDVYAVGGEPLVALNLLGWPRDVLSADLAAEVLRGRPGRHPRGGLSAGRRCTASTIRSRSTAWRSPASPTRTGCCGSTPGRAGPAAVADQADRHRVLNALHKATGEVFQRGGRGDDHPERRRQPGGPGGRPALCHRCHRLRAARACSSWPGRAASRP